MEIFPIPCHYCDMTYQMQNIHTVIRYNVWKLKSIIFWSDWNIQMKIQSGNENILSCYYNFKIDLPHAIDLIRKLYLRKLRKSMSCEESQEKQWKSWLI